MKTALALALAAGLWTGVCLERRLGPPPRPPARGAAAAGPAVWFSPRGGCTAELVARIDAAKKEVVVATYQLTSEPVRQALLRAHRRHGVRVRVIVDRGQAEPLAWLRAQGIEAYADCAHAIFHDKFVVVDGLVVVTGSFNFSHSAEERNAENMLTISDRGLAAQYLANWESRRAHAKTDLPPS